MLAAPIQNGPGELQESAPARWDGQSRRGRMRGFYRASCGGDTSLELIQQVGARLAGISESAGQRRLRICALLSATPASRDARTGCIIARGNHRTSLGG